MNMEERNPTLKDLGVGNRESFWSRTKGLGQHDTVKLKYPKSALAFDCWAVKLTPQTGFVKDTWTKITGWTERLDTGNSFSSDEYTIPQTGTLRVSVNLWAGTPTAGSTTNYIFVGLFKNGSLVTDTVRGYYIFAGYYNTGDLWWIGEATEGEVWDIRVLWGGIASSTTTNTQVGMITEFSGYDCYSFMRFELYQ